MEMVQFCAEATCRLNNKRSISEVTLQLQIDKCNKSIYTHCSVTKNDMRDKLWLKTFKIWNDSRVKMLLVMPLPYKAQNPLGFGIFCKWYNVLIIMLLMPSLCSIIVCLWCVIIPYHLKPSVTDVFISLSFNSASNTRQNEDPWT